MVFRSQEGQGMHRSDTETAELKLFVSHDLYRAFQRCVWILVNETGRDQQEIMEEAVQDFLVKHGC